MSYIARVQLILGLGGTSFRVGRCGLPASERRNGLFQAAEGDGSYDMESEIVVQKRRDSYVNRLY